MKLSDLRHKQRFYHKGRSGIVAGLVSFSPKIFWVSWSDDVALKKVSANTLVKPVVRAKTKRKSYEQ